ncbi:MAG: ATP-binding cassette domain-containing protein [Kiritimatiellae bacterium]|nr:ATP-binding cassette domain-containing protein [Kiritimatiellia bacterium]
MIVYELKDIKKHRADFCLRIENLEIRNGEIYAIMGDNGCGKTTLLNILAFMDFQETGSLIFKGMSIDGKASDLLPHRRRIACLLQNPYLFNVSVFENISYGLRVRGISKTDTASRVRRTMDRMGLLDLAERNAHTLSGGEAQRVALARTMVLDADVYLLDEPTANIDHRNIKEFENRIREIIEEKNATVVLSTHSKEQAHRMSPNIISIIDGTISDIEYQ